MRKEKIKHCVKWLVSGMRPSEFHYLALLSARSLGNLRRAFRLVSEPYPANLPIEFQLELSEIKSLQGEVSRQSALMTFSSFQPLCFNFTSLLY